MSRRKHDYLREGLALLQKLELYERRTLDRALYYLQCAIVSKPTSPRAYLGIAAVFFRQQRYEDECYALEEAIDLLKESGNTAMLLWKVKAELANARILASHRGNNYKPPDEAKGYRGRAKIKARHRMVHLASVGRR